MAIAVRSAESIDVSQLEQLRTPEQEAGTIYQELVLQLQNIVRANPQISSVYTMRPDQDLSKWQLVIDSTIIEDSNGNGVIDPDEDRAHLGEYYDVSCCSELQNSLVGQMPINKSPRINGVSGFPVTRRFITPTARWWGF
jgi:hypothetical protein